MDCSICMDAITKQTGVVTLSCEHSFHFRCIDEWFCKQVQMLEEDSQTCPCCRHKGEGLDRVAFVLEEDEDDEESDEESDGESDGESEDDSSLTFNNDRLTEMLMGDEWVLERNVVSGQLLFTPTIEIAFMQLRNLFGPLNDMDIQEPSKDVAAKKIQAIYRGYKARTAFESKNAARSLMRLFTSMSIPMKIKVE